MTGELPFFDLEKYDFYEVLSSDDLGNGERAFIELDDWEIVVFNIAGEYFAIADYCTHDDGPLGDGALDGYQVICPRHGARFDVRTGKALTLPAVDKVEAFPVRIAGGMIEIGIPK